MRKQSGESRARGVVVALLIGVVQLLVLTHAYCAEPLRLAVSLTPLSLPVFVAQQQGFFAAEGASLRVSDVIGGHRSLQQVFDGNADLATCSEAVVMFNSFKRSDFSVITTLVTSDDDIRIVARAGSGITELKHLAGKRVGTVTGAASHFYVDTSLLLIGVDPKSVRLINLQPEAMADSLQRGEVDAVAIWEPYAFMTQVLNADARTLPKSQAYTEKFNLVISNSVRGARDEDLIRILRALESARKFIVAEPLKAQAILHERLKMGRPLIDSLWPRYVFDLSLSTKLLTSLEREARWARREGLVQAQKSPDYSTFIHTGPLRKVRPASVDIED